MSATVTATPTIPTGTAANTPKPAIIAAVTSADVVRAMIDDPSIRSSVLNAFTALLSGKSFAGSKTVWVALIASIIIPLAAHFGLPVDQATAASVATVIMGVAMIVMRVVTKGGPVTSVLPTTKGPTP